MYQKKASQQEPRIPYQLDSTNLVEEVIPWCRPCDQFHPESTCYIENQVIEHGMAEFSNQETTSGESDHVYMVGRTYPLSNQHWQQATDYSYEKDLLSNFYGVMPSPEAIKEMKEAIFKGAVYQIKEKPSLSKQYKSKVTVPPLLDPPLIPESNVDMGEWISSAKIHVYATNVLKILGQKENLLKSIEDGQSKTHNIVKEDPLPNNNAIFEAEHIEPMDMPIVLNSVDLKREYHWSCYASLLVDNLLLHNCMLDSGASSNVMTRKVME